MPGGQSSSGSGCTVALLAELSRLTRSRLPTTHTWPARVVQLSPVLAAAELVRKEELPAATGQGAPSGDR